MANSVDPVQTAPIGEVCAGSTLFASILNLSVMLGNYLQQTTSADNIFRCIFFLGALRVNVVSERLRCLLKMLCSTLQDQGTSRGQEGHSHHSVSVVKSEPFPHQSQLLSFIQPLVSLCS